MLNIQKSRKVAQMIGAEKKACWRNSLLALLTLDELSGYQYVEGWVLYMIPFNHGWLVNEAGEIIDPTLVLNPITEEIRYFPGVVYSRDKAEKLMGKSLPAVENDGRGGRKNAAYREAEQAAFRALSE